MEPRPTPNHDSATDYVYHWSDYDDANQEDLLRAGRSGQGDPSCPLDGSGQPATQDAVLAPAAVVPMIRTEIAPDERSYRIAWCRLSAATVEHYDEGGMPVHPPRLLTHNAGWTGDAA
jgi:hypothetical protein